MTWFNTDFSRELYIEKAKTDVSDFVMVEDPSDEKETNKSKIEVYNSAYKTGELLDFDKKFEKED